LNIITPVCQVYGWTPDEIDRKLTLPELMKYHHAAVESQRKEREEIVILEYLAMNGKLGDYLATRGEETPTEDKNDGSPDIDGFRKMCKGHIKKSSMES